MTTTTLTVDQAELAATKVPVWPRFAATITPHDHSGLGQAVELRYNGQTINVTARTSLLARAYVLAEAAARAAEIGRTIAVNVNPDSDEPLRLAVRPQGIVQERDEDEEIDDAHDLMPAEYPCSACDTKTPLIGACVRCNLEHPFAREEEEDVAELTDSERALQKIFPAAEFVPEQPAPRANESRAFSYRHAPWIITLAAVIVVEGSVGAVLWFMR